MYGNFEKRNVTSLLRFYAVLFEQLQSCTKFFTLDNDNYLSMTTTGSVITHIFNLGRTYRET